MKEMEKGEGRKKKERRKEGGRRGCEDEKRRKRREERVAGCLFKYRSDQACVEQLPMT
jgi:hypothetical protein